MSKRVKYLVEMYDSAGDIILTRTMERGAADCLIHDYMDLLEYGITELHFFMKGVIVDDGEKH